MNPLQRIRSIILDADDVLRQMDRHALSSHARAAVTAATYAHALDRIGNVLDAEYVS